MAPFTRSLRRVCGAVYKCFESDEEFNVWLVSQRAADVAQRRRFDERLSALLAGLGTGWVDRMLVNEEQGEEQSLIAEAVAVSLSEHNADWTKRGDFAYQLTNAILNKGVRPYNRRTIPADSELIHGIELPTEAFDPENIGPVEREHMDDLVRKLIEKRAPKNEVASADIVLAVKGEWLAAIKQVEAKLGGARAKPLSLAVRQEVAERLGLDVATVEAAMKRLRRACRKALEEDAEGISDWLVQ